MNSIKALLYTSLTNAISRLLKTPQYIILFVSDVCWMKCRHCWYHESWKKNNLKGNSLSFHELERLADSIDRINFLAITGGEAFLRDDIVEITKMFVQKTKLNRYDIPTAGYEPELIISKTERILKTNPNIPFRVCVSLDGTENTHDIIRNVKGAYKRAILTIQELSRLKKRYSYFDVGVTSSISSYNQNEVSNLAKIISKIHPDGEWLVNITRGDSRDPCASDVDMEKYFMAHRIINKRIKQGSYKGHGGHLIASWLSAKNAVRRQVIMKILKGIKKGGGCAAGSLAGVIYNDGTVTPCEMLERSFGNIRDFDYQLPLIWNCNEANKTRAWIQETQCLCTHECFLSLSLLIQPQYWPHIIYERMKLFASKFVP